MAFRDTDWLIDVAVENLQDGMDIDDGRPYLTNAEGILRTLVENVLEREYPKHGELLDAIRAEAACKPHTAEWCKCRDAVTTEAMELADAIRAAKGTSK